MQTKEAQAIANKLVGRTIAIVEVTPNETLENFCEPENDWLDATGLKAILDDGTEIEIGASWNEDGEFHIYIL